MAASKCPKCGHPFSVRDGFGELLPLAHCAGCDSNYPLSAGACKWCGTAPVKAPIPPYLWKGVGVAAFLSLAIGAFLIRDEEPEPKPVVLLPAVDTTPVARTGDTVIAQPVLAPPPSGETATASQLVSTGVVGLDSTSTVAVVDSSAQPPGVSAAEESTTVAVGSTGTADSLAAALDALEKTTVVDSARSREPWLPPPSVIRRAPTPGVAPPPPSAPTPNVATAPAEEPPARTTPTRVAEERRTAVASPRATTTPARTKVKPPPPAKAVAKAAPKRTAPTVAASRTSRGKATATTSRTTAKAPAPRARTSSRWVTSVARRWVVVRADASGRARIIGSVGPDTRVQLGETRGGFRRIKSKGLAGWVDSRVYFAAVPVPRRAGRLAAQ